MERIIKAFIENEERDLLREKHNVLAEYEAFILLRVSANVAAKLAKMYPTEDITAQFKIPLESEEIQTEPRPRLARAATSARAKQGIKAPDKKRHHYLVQFIGPIKAEWLKDVEKTGGDVRQPFDGFTFIVRANQTTIDRIRVLPFVRWVGHLPHRERIDRNVKDALGGGAAASLPRTRVLPGVFVVEFFGPDDANRAKSEIKKLGFEILAAEPGAELLTVRFEGTQAQQKKALKALSAVHGVRMIRQRTLDRTSNNIAASIMGSVKSLGNPGLGLDGSGEVIAICDTGLDTGDPANIHDDFAGRVALIKSYPITSEMDSFLKNPRDDDGGADVDSGHGTHVAGSALGNGFKSVGLNGASAPIRGLAYKAKLVFQAVEQETRWKRAADLKDFGRFGLWGIPNDLKDLFNDAYKAKARVHSNSWGGGQPGEYDEQCRQLDKYVWGKKDFCVLVAAGNDGTDNDGDGKINSMSVTSPGTAKNCITVGASENARPEFNAEKYGEWWSDDYPTSPFKDDAMSNNKDQLAAFSSRGPTKDGRIKPDIVAPGTFILSTRSTQIAPNNMAWAAYPPSRSYFHMGGTSMATPLAAGAAAIVRQYLRTEQGIPKPTAALIKAVFIAGATKLKGFSSTRAVGDNHQGFGRINLDAILTPSSPATVKFIEAKGLATGASKSYGIKVQSTKVPLRIVLVYSDYPGSKLVNNLNLIVTDPSGKKYAGNHTSSGPLQLDSTNNVEVIRIAKPKTGAWEIQVIGSNVPKGPQDYALVILGSVPSNVT